MIYYIQKEGRKTLQTGKGIEMENLLNEIARAWGLEDENTIEAFNMAERGETVETIMEYKKLVEGARENDWFGFDL